MKEMRKEKGHVLSSTASLLMMDFGGPIIQNQMKWQEIKTSSAKKRDSKRTKRLGHGLAANVETPEKLAIQNEHFGRAKDLPREFKMPLFLSLSGMTSTEIAEELGISIGSVKYRLRRALELLRRQ